MVLPLEAAHCRDTAQSCERCLGAEAVGVAARGDQQLGRGVRADAVSGPQARVELGDGVVQRGREFLVLGGQGLDASGQALQGGQDGVVDGVSRGTQACKGLDQQFAVQRPVAGPDGVGRTDEDVPDLVHRGGAGFDRGPGSVVGGADAVTVSSLGALDARPDSAARAAA